MTNSGGSGGGEHGCDLVTWLARFGQVGMGGRRVMSLAHVGRGPCFFFKSEHPS